MMEETKEYDGSQDEDFLESLDGNLEVYHPYLTLIASDMGTDEESALYILRKVLKEPRGDSIKHVFPEYDEQKIPEFISLLGKLYDFYTIMYDANTSAMSPKMLREGVLARSSGGF